MPLKDLLLKYKIGQRILTYYETKNQLQENFRNKLCDIVISDIESKNIKYTFFKHYFVNILLLLQLFY